MWGSAFSDLAKKAHDLQEQASHISTPTFFNLDAMQDDSTAQEKDELFATPQPSHHGKPTANISTAAIRDSTATSAPYAPSLQTAAAVPQLQPTKPSSSVPTMQTQQRKQPVVTSVMKKKEVDLFADFDTPSKRKTPSSRSPGSGMSKLLTTPPVKRMDVSASQPVEQQKVITTAEQTKAKEPAKHEPTGPPNHKPTGPAEHEPKEPQQQSGWDDDALDTDDLLGMMSGSVQQQHEEEAPVVINDDLLVGVKTETTSVEEPEKDHEGVLDGTAPAVKQVPLEKAQTPPPSDEPKTEDIAVVDKKDVVVDESPLMEESSSKQLEEHTGAVTTEKDEEHDTAAAETHHDEDEMQTTTTDDDVTKDVAVEEGVTEHVEASEPESGGEHDVIVTEEENDASPLVTEEAGVKTELTAAEYEPVSGKHEDGPTQKDDFIPLVMTTDREDEGEETELTAKDEPVVMHPPQSPVVPDESVESPAQPFAPKKTSVEHVATDRGAIPQASATTLDELQRLQETHVAEISNLKHDYESQLQEVLASVNHDQCQAERQEVEQHFMERIRGKEEQLQELVRENEGYQLRIDALKREVVGTQAMLEQRDNAMGHVHASHNKNVELLEQKVKDMEEAVSLAKADTDKAKEDLQSAKNELGASNEAYATLKARVKVVATELKERRGECRMLGSKAAELEETNDQLETQIVNLQSQISDRDKGQLEKDREAQQLRDEVERLEQELRTKEKALKERGSVGEKALSTYKKKAQNALAVANARAAAANQAKEEAEMEAATAKTLSEEAIERARVAETAGKGALAEAKTYVQDVEREKTVLEKQLAEATAALKETSEEAEHVKNAYEVSRAAQEKLTEDVRLITHEREQERARNKELQRQQDESEKRLETMYDEVEKLREELRQAQAAAKEATERAEAESSSMWSHPVHPTKSDDSVARSDAEGTISMLEGELRDANRAIKELKDALKNAIANQSSNGHATTSLAPNGPARPSGPPGNESTPLFFAMEKQAELNTARDEITRLANLLGDAESSKMEAYEAMHDMKQRMEEAEARLQRYEKFGTAPPTAAHRAAGGQQQQQQVAVPTAAPGRDADGNLNLEYLKNIMMSYLNAKTLSEKKALIPVIAAVLCLTPQEQASALENLEESGSLQGVGLALFESFGTPRR